MVRYELNQSYMTCTRRIETQFFILFMYRIIEQLKAIAIKQKCYKIILDCGENNIPFYEKCGFNRKEIQMTLYFPENEHKDCLKK